jgi:hypothetical protein
MGDESVQYRAKGERNMMKQAILAAVLTGAVVLGAVTALRPPAAVAQEKKDERIFELRTYTAAEGKLDALNARFRDHTNKLFVKHGMELIGYWTPTDENKGAANTLIYILAHKSREAAAASWKAFRDDPEWKAALAESEKSGRLTTKVESVFMKPTDYSPMK